MMYSSLLEDSFFLHRDGKANFPVLSCVFSRHGLRVKNRVNGQEQFFKNHYFVRKLC